MAEKTAELLERLQLLYYVALATTLAVFIGAGWLGSNFNPTFYNGFFFLVIPIAGAFYCYTKMKHFKALLLLQQRWGKKDNRERDFSVISMLYKYTGSESEAAYSVDDYTWQDLHCDKLYCQVDRTLTAPGEAVLYRILRTPQLEEAELQHRAAVIKKFQEDSAYRKEVQAILLKMGRENSSDITSLLWEEIPPTKPYHLVFSVMAFAALLALFTPIIIGYGGIFIILGFLGLNSFIHYQENKQYSYRIPAITQLGSLLGAAIKLVKVDHGGVWRHDDLLESALKKTQTVRHSTRYLFHKATTSDMDVLYEYIKIYFLLEVRSFYKTIAAIKGQLGSLRKIYYALGELDALQAVASFRAGHPEYTEPRFATGSVKYSLTEGYHPLIEDAVANSVSIKDKSILVTGSNMSGKSTFLRTAGVCALLAQTIYTCPASSYEADFLKVLSSMSKADDLSTGKSFYYLEAERLLALIEAASDEVPSLCIIDELLSGTNYTERLAASEAILAYLAGHKCLVVAATHDLDLAERLADTYQCYHFTDRVTKEGLDFDYKLKEGISKSRNAIKLLDYLNYPDIIVNNAAESAAAFVGKEISSK